MCLRTSRVNDRYRYFELWCTLGVSLFIKHCSVNIYIYIYIYFWEANKESIKRVVGCTICIQELYTKNNIKYRIIAGIYKKTTLKPNYPELKLFMKVVIKKFPISNSTLEQSRMDSMKLSFNLQSASFFLLKI